MDFVGEDQLLTFNSLAAERIGEHDGLIELHVGIVIALDEQHGGTP